MQFNEALAYWQHRNPSGLAQTYANIGHIYEKRQVQKLAQQKQELYQLSVALRDIAKTFRLMSRPDSAFNCILSLVKNRRPASGSLGLLRH